MLNQDSLSIPNDQASLKKWRSNTPGCSTCIHLNNAGASLMPKPVIDAIRSHLDREIYHGGYEAAESVRDDITASYEAVAKLIGTKSSAIAIVENATVAVSQSLSSFDFKRDDAIITTHADYSSNRIMMLNLAKRFGIEIICADELPEGGADPESVRLLIQKYRPKLLHMSWIPTNSGLIQDAETVGEICKEYDVPYLLDACQAVGQIPVDVLKLNCDFLAATSRKFLRGPRGLGFLYVSDRMLNRGYAPMFPDNHGAELIDSETFQVKPGAARFENWESPYALVLGLGAAANYALENDVEATWNRIRNLADYTRSTLESKENVRNRDEGSHKCGIVTASFEGVHPETLMNHLRGQNINTSVSTMQSKNGKAVNSALRISPHYYNTTEEIDLMIERVDEIMINLD